MERATENSPFFGRVVVVSPHLDDAVLSLGATIAGAVRSDADVSIVTVFSGSALSPTPAGLWDRRSGFATEGQAVSVRQDEDRTACAVLGVSPIWLPFGDEQYTRHGTADEVCSAVHEVTAGADIVVIPGWPLTHLDHQWLVNLLLREPMNCGKVGLYAEQPYRYRQRRRGEVGLHLAEALLARIHQNLVWTSYMGSLADRSAKRAAIEAYQSQLLQLRLRFGGLRRMLIHEFKSGGEALAWLR